MIGRVALVLAMSAITACGGEDEAVGPSEAEGAVEPPEADEEIPQTPPPFELRGEAEGLLLVWFDSGGAHSATKRSDIPEGRRAQVRVDSLEIAPEDRLDPQYVWVADLRSAGSDGRYRVRTMRRDQFDALVDRAAAPAAAPQVAAAVPPPGPTSQTPSPSGAQADVIIYGASWCGACRSAAAYLRQRGIPFVERDIERDPAARSEMQAKARAAGVRPTGIPVIDVRGTILTGFDPSAIDRLLAPRGRAI